MKLTTLAPNQNVAETTEGKFFISYDTKICFIPNDGSPIQLDRSKWDYSKTTSKYRNQFLGEDTKTTQKNIDNGTYILTELN
jgi:hypothetical protein